MSEALTEALTTSQIEAAPVVEAPVVETPEPSEDDALGSAWDRVMTNNGADRGTDGKFASPAKNSAESAEQASPGGEEGAGEGEAAPVAESPAPANWNGLDDAWKALPAEHREKVKTHFDDLHRRMSDQGRQLASVKPISDHLTQAVQKFPEFKGMSPERIAQGALQLAAVQSRLERAPIDTILEVAQTYGVLPQLQAKLTGQQMPEGGQEISGLKREIASLKQQLQQASDPSQIETHVSRAFEGRAAQEAVNQFASDPANSFFADVEPHLPAFIPMAREMAKPGAPLRDVLQSAYEMAINAIPEIRAKVQAAAKTAAAETDAKRTEAARKAASINVKSTSTGKERLMTEQEALGSAYDRAMAS